jgi:hypothetical protein
MWLVAIGLICLLMVFTFVTIDKVTMLESENLRLRREVLYQRMRARQLETQVATITAREEAR